MNDLLELHEDFCLEAEFLNYRPATIKWYRESLRRFVNYYEGRVRSLSDATHESLRRYLYEKKLAGWKATTFASQYKGLKAFFVWCVKKGHLDANPLDGIERPRLEKTLPRRISQQDALRVVEYAFHAPSSYRFQRYRNRALLGLMLYAGLRAQETLDLRLGHVDVENATVFVQSGKGAKDRMIPMSPTLRRWLREYLAERVRLDKESEYVFTALRGGKPLTYRGLRRVIAGIREGTGIDFTPHRLRHTFATLMLEGGCDLFSLQKMLGHSQLSTTTIYLSASAKMLQAQIAKHPLG
ncbi:MAG: tyrosine-type recombinase/integrase [Myxococcales bacterium]|nr:tyrosine-type recombinase/integrase [Myxococcales bacterium]